MDGTYNEKGTIKFVTHLFLHIGTVVHWILFHIMGCGNENIILGLPWLKKINPRIDWVTETVVIPRKTDQTKALNYKTGITQRTNYTKPTYHEFLPNEYEREKLEYPDETFIRMIWEEQDFPTPNKFRKRGKEFIPDIRKTTVATELAKASTQTETTLPERYKEYASVFSEEETHQFPPSRTCDHEINLDDSFIPKVGKVFPLTPREQKATEDFLEENLWLGRIRPSNSPQASSFFFIDKKDTDDLRPCQDYQYVNSHTIKDAYPLPLVSDLIDKVKNATTFTNIDV